MLKKLNSHLIDNVVVNHKRENIKITIDINGENIGIYVKYNFDDASYLVGLIMVSGDKDIHATIYTLELASLVLELTNSTNAFFGGDGKITKDYN